MGTQGVQMKEVLPMFLVGSLGLSSLGCSNFTNFVMKSATFDFAYWQKGAAFRFPSFAEGVFWRLSVNFSSTWMEKSTIFAEKREKM
jgi:hypothetical protein